MRLNIALVIIFLTMNSNYLSALTMTCFVPKNNGSNTKGIDYIKLVEPKTTIWFSNTKSISHFVTPGCNKFQSAFYWTDSFTIKCLSTTGESIILKMNKTSSEFSKIYSKNNQNIATLVGFCKMRNN